MTMKSGIWLVGGILLGLAATNAQQAAPEGGDKAAALIRAKRDAVRKTFETVWIDYREGRGGMERLYWWLRRWLEAEQELSGKQKTALVAAAQGHLDRMARARTDHPQAAGSQGLHHR